MKKTIKEWLEELPEPYRTEALANLFEKNKSLVKSTLADALIAAFGWKITPQGYDYWRDIFDKLLYNEPLDFNEFVKTKLDEFTKKGIDFYFEGDDNKIKIFGFKTRELNRNAEFKTVIFDKSEEHKIIEATLKFAEEFLKIINH